MAHFLTNRAIDSFTAAPFSHGTDSSAGAPIWELVKVTASSITEVILLSSVGYLLARRGIIDKKTQTKINKMNISLFTPALLFSKVAFSLNPHRLAELAIVPAGFVIVTIVSTLAAWALSVVLRLSKAHRNFAIACAISPNSNSLPVALMQALVMEVPQLHWDEEGESDDTADGMLGRALTYLVLFSTLGMFLRWSVGATLLSTVEDDDEETVEQDREIAAATVPRHPRTGRLVDYEGSAEAASSDITANGASALEAQREPVDNFIRSPPEPLTDGGNPPIRQAAPKRTKSGSLPWARSFPNSPQNSRPGSIYRDDEDGEEENPPLATRSISGWTKFRRFTSASFYNVVVLPAKTINAFMTAPLWAATASIVVAMIQPLQQFLGSIKPLVGALHTAGACSIPLTMVVLGAYFIEEKSAVDQISQINARQRRPVNGGETTASISGLQATNEESQAAHASVVQSAPKSYSRQRYGSTGDGDRPRTGSAAGATDGSDGVSAEEQRSLSTVSQMWPMSRLRRSPSSTAHQREHDESPVGKLKAHRAKMERRTIFAAVVSRMIITPLVLIPVIAWYAIATHKNVVDDPVFIACACLIVGSPPALTLAQITSQRATGNAGFERLISRTIFVSYAILAAPTTIVLVLAALLISQYD